MSNNLNTIACLLLGIAGFVLNGNPTKLSESATTSTACDADACPSPSVSVVVQELPPIKESVPSQPASEPEPEVKPEPKAAPPEQPKAAAIITTDPLTCLEPKDGKATIVMISMKPDSSGRSPCSWCDKWLREEAPKFKASGWEIVVTYDVSVPKYPSFRVYTPISPVVDGQRLWYGRLGYMTTDNVQTILDTIKNWKPPTKIQQKLHEMREKSLKATLTRKGVYTGSSKWSYPGDIAYHLCESPHNVDPAIVESLSQQELEQMHDRWHNQHGPWPPSSYARSAPSRFSWSYRSTRSYRPI